MTGETKINTVNGNSVIYLEWRLLERKIALVFMEIFPGIPKRSWSSGQGLMVTAPQTSAIKLFCLALRSFFTCHSKFKNDV
jgi:hypothetical protein